LAVKAPVDRQDGAAVVQTNSARRDNQDMDPLVRALVRMVRERWVHEMPQTAQVSRRAGK
jgi:hypothetical protein